MRLMNYGRGRPCGFVKKKSNVKYIWIVMHRESRQIIAFEVGDRTRETAKKLWNKIPDFIKKYGLFHTDDWDSYKTVITEGQHLFTKIKKYTNHIERFNCTLRHRISRLVRQNLAFSKDLSNHIGAIKYFICDYNLKLQKITAP
jgi:insertion element IS1 protein InsB